MGITNNPLSVMGMIIVIHAGYSMAHYKSLFLDTGSSIESVTVPLDVIIELLIGVFIILLGSVFSIPKLIPVKQSNTLHKTYESLGTPPEFAIFNHRGKALRSRYPSLAKEVR